MKTLENPRLAAIRDTSIDDNNGLGTTSWQPSILIIDDYENMRNFIQAVVSTKINCRTVDVATSEEALSLADKDEFDLVISDLFREGLNGFQFLKLFKKAHKNVPVIIVSGRLESANERRAYRLGAFNCMSKPFITLRLLSAVSEALEYRKAKINHTKIRMSPKPGSWNS